MQKNVLTMRRGQAGFTLIEILLVMALLAALATIVLIAINPAQKFKQQRDTQRTTDLASIAGAVQQYYVDHQGQFPSPIDTTVRTIKNGSGAGIADLCAVLSPSYLVVMPKDPSGTYTDCTAYDTKYTIKKESSTSDRIVVTAAGEINGTITITR